MITAKNIQFPIAEGHLYQQQAESLAGNSGLMLSTPELGSLHAHGIMALLPEDTCTILAVAMASTQLVRDHELAWIECESEEHKWASIAAQVTYQFEKYCIILSMVVSF